MFRAGLIGLGNIAALYSTPEDPLPYCHAGGIRLTKGIKLVAAAEPDAKRRAEVGSTWGIPKLYENADQMLAGEHLDVAAVCAKGPLHLELSRKVIEADVPVLFLEKPAGLSMAEVDEIANLARKHNTFVVVSYTRHWGPHMLEAARLIHEGVVGQVLSVNSYCGGGIVGFAVHNVDMLCQFAGYDPARVFARLTEGHEPVPDGFESEPHVNAAIVDYAGGASGFFTGDPGKRPSFSVEVMGSKGYARIAYYGKAEFFDADGNPVALKIPEDKSPFEVAYGQIVAYLESGKKPECGPEQFVAVNEIVFGMIESGLGNQPVTLPNARRIRKIYCMG